MKVHRMRRFFLDVNVIGEQLDVLYDIHRYYTNYRKIFELCRRLEGDASEEFFISVLNSCAMSCVMSWCLLFGNPRNSKIHWHKSAPESGASVDGDEINNEHYKVVVRSILEGVCAENGKILEEYMNEMIAFRNKYAAHRDLGNYKPLPFLDVAIEIASAYMDWLGDEIFWGEPLVSLKEFEVAYEPKVDAVLKLHEK